MSVLKEGEAVRDFPGPLVDTSDEKHVILHSAASVWFRAPAQEMRRVHYNMAAPLLAIAAGLIYNLTNKTIFKNHFTGGITIC